MKTLILLRHAKSEDPQMAETDFERHLKNKGKQDILQIAEKSIQSEFVPDLILCSTAVRTRETLEIYASLLITKPDIHFTDALYHASASEILDTINDHTEAADTIMVVGHNMGISNLASLLSAGTCPELPTSGMAIIKFEAAIEPGQGKLHRFFTPKTL